MVGLLKLNCKELSDNDLASLLDHTYSLDEALSLSLSLNVSVP